MKTKKFNPELPSLQKLDGIKIVAISAMTIISISSANIAFADETSVPNEANNNLEPKIELVVKREANKSYLIPAAEIVGFDFLLNQFNRRYSGISDYDSNLTTIRHNLSSSWKDDKDPFSINQLGHPYQGSMYHGFARSAGLSYWESLGYTLGGSAFWEIAGEKVPPSKNDMISTGFGGSFLGEALFRMSSLVLERGGSKPSIWREAGAAMISPSAGFNR
ncbi:MAG: DUF3943 domain-containing protein, partial [Pseudomonadota bacterium]